MRVCWDAVCRVRREEMSDETGGCSCHPTIWHTKREQAQPTTFGKDDELQRALPPSADWRACCGALLRLEQGGGSQTFRCALVRASPVHAFVSNQATAMDATEFHTRLCRAIPPCPPLSSTTPPTPSIFYTALAVHACENNHHAKGATVRERRRVGSRGQCLALSKNK
jgi:hypothetical protein